MLKNTKMNEWLIKRATAFLRVHIFKNLTLSAFFKKKTSKDDYQPIKFQSIKANAYCKHSVNSLLNSLSGARKLSKDGFLG